MPTAAIQLCCSNQTCSNFSQHLEMQRKHLIQPAAEVSTDRFLPGSPDWALGALRRSECGWRELLSESQYKPGVRSTPLPPSRGTPCVLMGGEIGRSFSWGRLIWCCWYLVCSALSIIRFLLFGSYVINFFHIFSLFRENYFKCNSLL